MTPRVCPWWLGGLIANPFRRLIQDPRRILSPHLSQGMTVLEPGPGVGFFTLEIARLVGPSGRVVAVEVQPRMLAGLARRARKAGLSGRIETRLAGPEGLGIDDLAGRVDFALAFAVVHEVRDPSRFLGEVARALRPGGLLLLAEPGFHVSRRAFEATLRAARAAGFSDLGRPKVPLSRSALLAKA